jgi:hypothetical protein
LISICQSDLIDAKLHEKPGDQMKSASPKKEEKGIVKPAVSLSKAPTSHKGITTLYPKVFPYTISPHLVSAILNPTHLHPPTRSLALSARIPSTEVLHRSISIPAK